MKTRFQTFAFKCNLYRYTGGVVWGGGGDRDMEVKVSVEEGEEVEEGQALCTIEAMKMENILKAEKKGTVSKINASAGESLAVDEIIMEFE